MTNPDKLEHYTRFYSPLSMKELIFCVILLAAQARVQARAVRPCPMAMCTMPQPVSCPADSVLITGITLQGQCCPQPGRCECKPTGCVRIKCPRGYNSILVSKGSGNPGNCCNVYKCQLDCSLVMCPDVMPPLCPRGTTMVKRDTPIPGDCCNIYECRPATDCSLVMCPDVMPPLCPSGTRLVKRDTPIPGDCCNIYECRPEMNCALVKCAVPEPPVCPPGTTLIKHDPPRPWDCCNPYECIKNCTLVKCGWPVPNSCPKDSVWIDGIILPGECCPEPGGCKCNPAGCVEKRCRPGYFSVLVSLGSGTPGDCCNVYECQQIGREFTPVPL